MSCWKDLDGKCLESMPENYWGFVYLITCITNGKIYVGKKQFTFRRKKKLSKKARVGTRKRVVVESKESNWKSYWGSNLELCRDVREFGEDKFTRKILRYAENKTQLTYFEMVEQINHNVLTVDSYNGWIGGKVFKKNLLCG